MHQKLRSLFIYLPEYNAHFGGSSHLLFSITGVNVKSKFEISLKPEYGNGIIFYIGVRNDGRGDFASLALVDGFLEFR